MKTTYLLSIVLLSMTAAVAAQDRATDKSGLPPVQAPPAMSDPGVQHPPVASAPVSDAKTKQDAATTDAAAKHSAASPGLPPDVQAAANAAELPVITVRQRGSDTIEEYRKHGKLIFRKVVTKDGPTKLYVDNPGDIPPDIMKQLSGPSGVVQPVYYKLYEWK
ncbi:MAG: DUF2782 domain-containing protein [Rudaea sp.]